MSTTSHGGAAGQVTLQHRGRISLVTLNRPEVRNALSHQMVVELRHALSEASRHERTRAIVLTGAGPAFCAGDDLSEALVVDADAFARTIEELQQVTRILLDSGKPSVAAVNGAAIGGGLELTLACDLRVAARHALFSCPEVTLGLVCTNGASVLLPAIVGHGRAREMLLTGRRYDAAWALAAGLVSEVRPAGDVLDRAIELADALAGRARAVRLTRDLLNDGYGDVVAAALRRETAAVSTARRSDAAEEGLRAFAARRAAEGRQP